MGLGSCYVFFYENGREDQQVGPKVPRGDEADESVLGPFRDWFESLSNLEQVCWAYGITPSEYDDLASTEIWYDVTYKLRVRLGETTVGHLQQHYTMVKVISQALGGSEKKPSIKVNDMASPEQAVNQLNDFFGAN